MKKRIISLLIVLCLVVGVFPAISAAEEIASGTCGENLIWVLTEDGTLRILGEGDMENFLFAPWWRDYRAQILNVTVESGVTSIGSYAFYGCTNLESIILPESIASIGMCAFYDCESLKTISIPNSVTTIQHGTFMRCKSLKSIILPENLTSIGSSAFSLCTSLTKVDLPSGVTTLESGLFYQCSSLSELDIPDSVTVIEQGVFYGCSSLTHLDIPDGVTKIEEDTFSGCTNLNVTIPRGVTEIGDEAFYQCASLTDVVIPAVTSVIYDGAFTGCTALQAFEIEDGNSAYHVVDGLLFLSETNMLIAVPGARSGVVVVPEGTTRTSYCAFMECPYVTEVVLPDSITRVGVFHGCTSLSTITFPASVRSVDVFPFYNCTSLKTVYFEGDNPSPDSPIFGRRKPLIGSDTVSPMGDDSIDIGLIYSVTADAYYPYDNENWTDDERSMCGGNITWIPYDPANPFCDVSCDTFYHKPVMWAVESGITNGLTETTFGPTATCNRAQVVTFLWRAAGCPEPETASHDFVDVQAGSFYEKPVLWAVENGITNGSDATHFNPNGVCNRAQVVTFLYRAFGSPDLENAANPFTDVPSGIFYERAVLWAVENGITNGVDATHFGPNSACNRAAVVTFLYRAYVD